MFTIAVPTTAGTAAEVTINYVITDVEKRRKFVCVDTNDIPEIAVVDPEMMASMPKGLTAATGMDALTHAIEGYITKGHCTISDMFHLEAIKLISQSLRGAVQNTPEGREGMALGQYIAGMGFSNVGLGIVHSMAHGLSALYDTPHGVACAILLPVGLEYNKTVAGERYRAVGKAMGVTGIDEMNDVEAADATIAAVKQLSADVGIPANLKGILKEEDIQFLAESRICGCVPPRQSPRHQRGRDRGAVQEPAVRVSRKRLRPLPRGFATFADQRPSKVARKRFCFAKSYTREPGRAVLHDDRPADGAGWSARMKKAPAFPWGRQVLLGVCGRLCGGEAVDGARLAAFRSPPPPLRALTCL